MESVSQVCTKLLPLAFAYREQVSNEVEEQKKQQQPRNLSAFPSALEVRRIQRGRTSDVTELQDFITRKFQCTWVSAQRWCWWEG